MRRRTINSIYRQFYVADAGLSPPAPEIWTDEDVAQRFNAEKHVIAFCPEGDISARIIVVPPKSRIAKQRESDFEVSANLRIDSGKLGVFEWPWELLEEFDVTPGDYQVWFRGYDIEAAEAENDYYVVEFMAT